MSYSNANLSTAQAVMIGKAQAGALRERTPEVTILTAQAGAEFYNGIETLKGREAQPTTLHIKDRVFRAVGTTYTHNHTGNSATVSNLTPTWETVSDKFSVSLKQANGNLYGMQEMLNNEYENALKNLARGVNTKVVAYIDATRDTTTPQTGETTRNTIKNVNEIQDATAGDRAVQISGLVMDILAWNGILVYYCDSIAYAKFQKLSVQLATNATNQSFQFENKMFIHCPQLTASAGLLSYTKGYWLVAQEGQVALMEWLPKQNRDAVEVTGISKYSTVINPLDTLDYGVHEYAGRADGTSVGGGVQDVIFEYQIHTDITINSTPLLGGATPIQGFALV